MEKINLLPLPSSSVESTDDESDSAIDSDDEIIENVTQMLDNVMDITNLPDKSQGEEDVEEEEQSPIDISKSSISDTTAIVSQSRKSSDGNDKLFLCDNSKEL